MSIQRFTKSAFVTLVALATRRRRLHNERSRQWMLLMRLAGFLLFLASFGVGAVVIRDDVPDIQYRMAASEFPALADMPGEGHGVLIAPQWVVTAAHAVSWHHSLDVVVVGGVPRAVKRVVIHPEYKKPPQELIDSALGSGDWEAFFKFMTSSDDIALVQLSGPVRDIPPARFYSGSALGKVVRIMGRGATGRGSKGHHLHGPNRTDLRHGFNKVSFSGERWIGYVFDAPPNALPLEASTGSGDSGGPMLISVGKEWQVAGIAAWKRGVVNGTEVFPGKYGEVSYGVRLEHYADWIRTTMAMTGVAK